MLNHILVTRILAPLLLVLAVTLTGCGQSSSPTSQAGDNTGVSVASMSQTAREQVYLQTLRARPEAFPQAVRDHTLLANGYGLCNLFDKGLSWYDVLQLALKSGYSAGNSGYLIGVSVHTLCPGHDDALPAN